MTYLHAKHSASATTRETCAPFRAAVIPFHKAVRMLIFSCMLFGMPMVQAAPYADSGGLVTLIEARFGYLTKHEGGRLTFTDSMQVPYRLGMSFGWALSLSSPNPVVTWREEFTLPARPVTWPLVQDISADGRTARTVKTEMLVGEPIINFWTIAEGDPVGRHVIHIFIEDRLVHTFEFDIE
jgi:hypothetical protein